MVVDYDGAGRMQRRQGLGIREWGLEKNCLDRRLGVDWGDSTTMVTSYRDLQVWQEGMDLARVVFKITRDFPKNEVYGLTSQMMRCAVSIPSDIAEGHSRESSKEFLRHLSIAQGSLSELETQLLLAADFAYLPKEMYEEVFVQTNRLGRMLRGLQKSLQKRINEGRADRT